MLQCLLFTLGFPGGSDDKKKKKKKPPCNAGDPGLIPGLGTSSGGVNGSLLQDSCLENSMNRGVWQAPVHGLAKSQT